MRGQQRQGRPRPHILDTAHVQVADVEHHAQPLHLGEHVDALRRQPPARGLVQATAVGQERAPAAATMAGRRC